MRKIFKTLSVAIFALLLLAGCKKDDAGKVTLQAFGPCPILRGTPLTILGNNLDNVTAVVFPGHGEVTQIDVVSKSEIRVVVPQSATEGPITIRFEDGEIISKASLSFTEPYSIASVSPATARAGNEITISGDYLWKITSVVFSGTDAVIDSVDFVEKTRTTIKVNLPREAVSGRFYITDGYGNQLYSDSAINVIQPVITGFSPTTVKAGGNITVTGTNMDLIKSITFAGGVVVEDTSFVSRTLEEIVITVPARAQSGVITGTAYSLITTSASGELTMLMPTISSVTPTVDLTHGTEITVTGTNLDLVSSVSFPNVVDGVNPTAQTATEVKVAFPEVARSGRVLLNMVNGDTVGFNVSTLKPAVTGYTPNPVQAGTVVTIAGTNLDLVASLKFGGNKAGKITATTATELTVEVPIDATTGEVVFTMTNGETAVAPELTIELPVFCFAPTLPEGEINAGEMVIFDVLNGDKLTGVEVKGAAAQYILTGAKLYVLVPNNANGNTAFKFISSNGEVTYMLNVIGKSGPVETVVWTGPVDMTWNDGGRAMVSWSAFEDVPAGSILKITFTQHEAWGQVQINNGAWTQINFAELGGSTGTITTDFLGDKTITFQEFVLTQEVLTNLETNNDVANDRCLILQGNDWTIVQISIITTGGGGGGGDDPEGPEGLDPVQDPEYVYFDFNDETKNSWWGQVNVNTHVGDLWQGVENDPAFSVDGTPYAHVNNGEGLFFRNSANNMKLDGVTLTDWVVKFDVRVLSGSGAIRLELQSGGTQYMAIVNLENKNDSWYTATVPFSDFVDNWGIGTNPLPDLNIDEFGAADGGAGNTMELLIDNVRFEHK
ncbi:MAG: IPT/TIG domain-containing protein [Bacteroidales bacterium]|jgi:hypothetical protein|nr:IPT/TIG domain-containing protein [Bacteroidales bacterium]